MTSNLYKRLLFNFNITLIFLISSICVQAQNWDFPDPVVNSGNFSFDKIVYVSLEGQDSNDGSIENPVKTFNKAIDLLPFGSPGINDGHAYGLIRILEGNYVFYRKEQESENIDQRIAKWEDLK